MAVAGYNIYLAGVKQNTTLVTNLTYALSGLTASTAYNVTVSAVDDAGNESAQSAAVNFSTTAAVTELQSITFDASTTIFDATNYKIAKSSPVNQLWSPVIFYKGGKTLAAFLVAGTNRFNVLEYTSNGLKPIHRVYGSSGQYDSHDHPVLHWENDRLYVVQENYHNVNPSKIHKTKANNDSLIFESNLKNLGTEGHTYFNLTENNGALVSVGQYNDTQAGFLINTSGAIEGTWSTNKKLLSLQSGEAERYQMGVNNKYRSNDIIIISAGRNDLTTTPTWFRFNVFKARVNASGFLDYYKVDGTLIREVSTEVGTPLSDAELATTEFYYTGSNTAQAYQPVPSLDELGNFYCVHENGSGGYVLSIWKSSSATPVNQALTFPDAPTLVVNNPDQWGACVYVMPEKPSKIDLFFKVNNGTRIIIRQYRSVDEGVTLTFVQDIDFGFDAVSFGIAANYISIGNNQNFIAIAGGDNATDQNGPVQLGVKKAAFGAIQAEAGNIYNSLTPITEAAYNSSAVASYFIENGKVNLTNTVVDSLIDQSLNATVLTSLGSPVVDNATTPTEITLDGVNDAFSLNPALLVTGKAYLFISVVDILGNDYIAPATISNNTNANSFILPEIRGAAVNRMDYRARQNTIAVEEVDGDTVVAAGYHIYAWLYRGYGNDVPMWYDGKMQLRNVITEPSENEGAYILPNGNTNLEIGRMVRNTTGYLNFKMKHTAIHEVISEAEILDRIKFLGNKYGITLLNAYR
jgi:hypothetical protein